MNKLFTITTAAIAAVLLATSIAAADEAQVKKDVDVHLFPDSDSDVTGHMHKGEVVDVADCDDGWCYVAAYDGYVREKRLDFDYSPPPEEARACFYEHINYEGAMFCESVGTTESIIDMSWNDMISSVKLYGGAKVQVCEHINFGGACSTWVKDKPSVGSSWNDLISSYSVY